MEWFDIASAPEETPILVRGGQREWEDTEDVLMGAPAVVSLTRYTNALGDHFHMVYVDGGHIGVRYENPTHWARLDG